MLVDDINITFEDEPPIDIQIEEFGGGGNHIITEQNGGLHGSGTAADPLGVNDLTRDELIDILDKTGFPTAFLKG